MSSTPSPLSAAMPPPGGEGGASPASSGGAGGSPRSAVVSADQDADPAKPAGRRMEAGEMIPSEMELAARYKVSQGTVRKAIDELAAENLVARRQGKGTFVTTHSKRALQFRFLRPDAGAGRTALSEQPCCWSASACAPRPRSPPARTQGGDSVVQIRRILFFWVSRPCWKKSGCRARVSKG